MNQEPLTRTSMSTVAPPGAASWLLHPISPPDLLPAVLPHRHEPLPRFATTYQQLRVLPRRVRQVLQRRWKQSLAGVALLLTLGDSQVAQAGTTINVSGGDVAALI